MTYCVDQLGPILNQLLNCVEQAFDDCGVPVCRSFLTIGNAPYDVCCECGEGVGQAWVALGPITPVLPASGEPRCGTTNEASLVVGILRCALVMDDQGNPPDADALSLEALAIMRDRLIVNQAIKCCFAGQIELDDWTIGGWAPVAPEGGCIGGEQVLRIRFSDVGCC